MTTIQIGAYTLTHDESRVTVLYADHGYRAATELWMSWYGWHLGYREPFADEESAHFAFTETAVFLQDYAARMPSIEREPSLT
jgi:hypothetical protein